MSPAAVCTIVWANMEGGGGHGRPWHRPGGASSLAAAARAPRARGARLRRHRALRSDQRALRHRQHQHGGVDHAQPGALRVRGGRGPGRAVRVLALRPPVGASHHGGRGAPGHRLVLLRLRLAGRGEGQGLGRPDRVAGARPRRRRGAPRRRPPRPRRRRGPGGAGARRPRRAGGHGARPGGQVRRRDRRHARLHRRLRGRHAGHARGPGPRPP